MDKTGATDRKDSGFALLLVLWALVLLSLIITQLLAAGRREAQLAGNLRQAAVAETLADSAVQDSIFLILTGDRGRSAADVRVLALPGGSASIRIRNLAGLVNPNMAPAPLLTALLEECGASASVATLLTQSITDWRSPNDDPRALRARYRAAGLTYAPLGQAFQTRDEIRLVLGMTPAIADCLVPHLSVFGDTQVPTPTFADPVVLRSLMRMMRQTGATTPMAPDQPGALAVEIIAEGRSGSARYLRDATVRFSDSGQAFRILTWQHDD
ncbi:general secretion pathway protein GspK [Acidisoma cellulosilytica]|uniref:General secretion pathway protein GspK n=1 Tax=Acidisoma cellulosilyticum TaxID=2802395 RepID=A0A963Z5C9_9PROT|nr:type II secretion system protein GspK [Acidisoma cellulosilyticum]MCB8883210.1 general secretion pathway protein GspK [Acidisoma cellulosilyticum]